MFYVEKVYFVNGETQRQSKLNVSLQYENQKALKIGDVVLKIKWDILKGI